MNNFKDSDAMSAGFIGDTTEKIDEEVRFQIFMLLHALPKERIHLFKYLLDKSSLSTAFKRLKAESEHNHFSFNEERWNSYATYTGKRYLNGPLDGGVLRMHNAAILLVAICGLGEDNLRRDHEMLLTMSRAQAPSKLDGEEPSKTSEDQGFVDIWSKLDELIKQSEEEEQAKMRKEARKLKLRQLNNAATCDN